MISDAREGDDDFTMWLTNPTDECELPDIGKGVRAFFDAEKGGGAKVSGDSAEVGGFVGGH